MQTIALVIHVFLALGVIGLVLIQHGKGAEAGAAFGGGGGGASGTVFGSKGSGSFLTRATTLFALAFFCTSMLLFFMAAQRSGSSGIGSVVDGVEAPAAVQQDVPTVDGGITSGANGASDVPAVPAADVTGVPAATDGSVPATDGSVPLPTLDSPVPVPTTDVPSVAVPLPDTGDSVNWDVPVPKTE